MENTILKLTCSECGHRANVQAEAQRWACLVCGRVQMVPKTVYHIDLSHPLVKAVMVVTRLCTEARDAAYRERRGTQAWKAAWRSFDQLDRIHRHLYAEMRGTEACWQGTEASHA